MGSWFSSADNEQTSSTDQEVKITGNNNVVTLHEEHAQVLRDIRVTLISMAGIFTIVVIIIVIYYVYKVCKSRRQRKIAEKRANLKKQISMELLHKV